MLTGHKIETKIDLEKKPLIMRTSLLGEEK